jgi:hypothetical protein
MQATPELLVTMIVSFVHTAALLTPNAARHRDCTTGMTVSGRLAHESNRASDSSCSRRTRKNRARTIGHSPYTPLIRHYLPSFVAEGIC